MTTDDFKYHFNIIKSRCSPARNTTDKHRKIHDLDFEIGYLKEIWDSQQGVCPITGYALVLKTFKESKEKLLPNHASVDRIDNNKGYVKGNIRFISVMANYALNNKFSEDDLEAFAQMIVAKRIMEKRQELLGKLLDE